MRLLGRAAGIAGQQRGGAGGHGGAARSLPHGASREMPRGRKEVGEDVAGRRDPHVSGTCGGM
jgi:hypothetical protein